MELIQAARELTRYLAAGSQQPTLMTAIGTQIQEVAERSLPARVPLGLAHGDYAPRNVFIGPRNRVTPFDALPRWRAPIYEDRARMLVAIRTGRMQVSRSAPRSMPVLSTATSQASSTATSTMKRCRFLRSASSRSSSS